MKKLLSSWNTNSPQTLVLVKSLIASISTTYMKRALTLSKIVSKVLWRSSHTTISVWWLSLVPRVQTSITLKCLSCLVSKNFKAEECQLWSQVRLFLPSLPTIPIQELQVSSATDSWLVSGTKNSTSIAWLEEKVLSILPSKHQEVDTFKGVWWSIWKVLKLNTITQSEIAMEVSFNFCMDKIPSIQQKKNSSTKWSFWVKISHCWKKSSSTMNLRVTWNGAKLSSLKRQRLARKKLFCKNSIQGKTWVQFHKNAIQASKQANFQINSMKCTH